MDQNHLGRISLSATYVFIKYFRSEATKVSKIKTELRSLWSNSVVASFGSRDFFPAWKSDKNLAFHGVFCSVVRRGSAQLEKNTARTRQSKQQQNIGQNPSWQNPSLLPYVDFCRKKLNSFSLSQQDFICRVVFNYLNTTQRYYYANEIVNYDTK